MRQAFVRRSLPHLLLVAVLLTVTACKTTDVHNVPRTAYTTPVSGTMEAVGEAIWAAGRREGWRVREVSPGDVRAEKSVRTHRALVRIDYDTQGYAITLLEADGLQYDGHHIHKAYNQWVEQLDKAIKDEMQFRFR